MKKLISFALFIILSFEFILGVNAAEIKTGAPYDGEYLLVYNKSDSSSYASTGVLQSQNSDLLLQSDSLLGEYLLEPGAFLVPTKLKPKNTDLFSMQTFAYTEKAIGYKRNFSSQNLVTGEDMTKASTLIAKGRYCDVYVEDSAPDEIKAVALDFANEFDLIRDFMVENFGDYRSNSPQKNGKIDIFIEDIYDGFDGESSLGYTGGYFTGRDGSFYANANGNNSQMVHIDYYPTIKYNDKFTLDTAKSVLVHEFQHLINNSKTIERYMTTGVYKESEIWINEAFSESASYLFYGETNRLANMLSSDRAYGNILKNGSVLNWTDYSTNSNSITANYTMAFLVGQYLRVQTKNMTGGGNQIYKTALNNNVTDAETLVTFLNKIGYEVEDFNEFNKNFRIANVLKEKDGVYGYMGEEIFDEIQYPLNTSSSLSLRGGATIIRKLNSSFTPKNADSEIEFVSFSRSKANSPVSNKISDAYVYGTKISLNTDTFLADVYYTLNGKTPTQNSQKFNNEIEITGDITLKAVSYRSDYHISDVAVYEYSVREKGDINGDGYVSGADVLKALRGSVGIEHLTDGQVSAIDFNQDETVSTREVKILLKYVIGQINNLNY